MGVLLFCVKLTFTSAEKNNETVPGFRDGNVVTQCRNGYVRTATDAPIQRSKLN